MWYLLSFVIFTCISLVNCNGVDNKLYKDIPDTFLKDCLVTINKYRKLHGAFPLRWNADLQYHAQKWADHLASNGNLENDVEGVNKLNQGETVSYTTTPPKKRCQSIPPSGDCYACRTTIATWYNESKYYDYESGYSNDGAHQVLHFTQLVWKETTKVGIATAISPRYGLITVARFRPRGNIGFVDDYVRNVQAAVKEGDSEKGQGGVPTTDEVPTTDQELPRCRQTKHKRKAKECVNVNGDELCDYYIKTFEGYCDYNHVFMRKHCAKSCNFCKDRFPAPAKETKEEKKRDLRWEVEGWLECHGGFQWRAVHCIHKFKKNDYQIQSKYCVKSVGPKPAEYKNCP